MRFFGPLSLAVLPLILGCSDPNLGAGADLAGRIDGLSGTEGDLARQEADLSPGADLRPMCLTSAECFDVKLPVCAGGVCRACAGASEDNVCIARGEARCITIGPSLGSCGSCNPLVSGKENADCTARSPLAPICGEAGACAACTEHAQCASGICDRATGRCPSQDEVAYVDNFDGSLGPCSDFTTDSSTKPYCEVNAAIAKSGKRFIKVAGSAQPYGEVDFLNFTGQWTVVGPGVGSSPEARVSSSSGYGVNLQLSSGTTVGYRVLLDGLVIGGPDVAPSSVGVNCNDTSGAATIDVTIRNSRIDYSSDGIWFWNCSVTVEDSVITGTANNAVYSRGGTVVLRGSSIAGNSGGGVYSQDGCSVSITDCSLNDNGGEAIHLGPDLADCELTVVRSTLAKNGAGISVNCMQTTIEGSTIDSNTGVGFYSSAGASTIRDSKITYNRGGGIDEASGGNSLTLTNCLITDNGRSGPSGPMFGGVEVLGGDATIVNWSLIGNTTKTAGVTGIASSTTGSVVVLNTLVFQGWGGTMNLTGCTTAYSAYEGAPATNSNVDLTGCLGTDLFVDYDNGDYRPKAGSNPCNLVDNGAATFMTLSAPSKDLLGSPRPAPPAGAYDIGCYEKQ